MHREKAATTSCQVSGSRQQPCPARHQVAAQLQQGPPCLRGCCRSINNRRHRHTNPQNLSLILDRWDHRCRMQHLCHPFIQAGLQAAMHVPTTLQQRCYFLPRHAVIHYSQASQHAINSALVQVHLFKPVCMNTRHVYLKENVVCAGSHPVSRSPSGRRHDVGHESQSVPMGAGRHHPPPEDFGGALFLASGNLHRTNITLFICEKPLQHMLHACKSWETTCQKG